MTKVWAAADGWVYLHVAVDCCTREVTCWRVDLRTRAEEAIACVESGLLARAVPPGRLTLGSDNGSQGGFNRWSQHLLMSEVVDDGDGGLEQEDQRCARGCASAVASRSGASSGDAFARAA